MKITNRQAIEAQFSLSSLLGMNLPVKSSWSIARLSEAIDRQVNAFSKARDAYIRSYKVKFAAGSKEGSVTFTIPFDEAKDIEKEENRKALEEFIDKVNELAEAEGADIDIKMSLPANITLSPSVLKPLIPFIEWTESNVG